MDRLFEVCSLGINTGQEQDVNDLMKARDELTQERDKLLNDVTQLRRDLDDNSIRQSDLERQIQEGNQQVVSLQEKITQAKTENMKEAKKRVCILFISHKRFQLLIVLGTN